MHISDRRLYLDDTGHVVEAGAPDARWLLCAAGAELSDEVAAQYGLDAPAEVEPQLSVADTLAVADTLNPDGVAGLLAEELSRPKPRKTLVAKLEALTADDEG